MQHILTIDQGTTGTTALVLDEHLQLASCAGELGRGYREFAQHFPEPGLVEHDADEILASVRGAVGDALTRCGVAGTSIAAIGITNQRETVVLWDRATGRPVYRAIVWQDRRTAEGCRRRIQAGEGDAVRAATGLPIDPYFSASKLSWLLDQGDLRKRAQRGELAFGTIDSWLLHALTGGSVHATDVSNASRTMLFDIHRLEWSEALLEAFDIPNAVLPEVRPCTGVLGKVQNFAPLPDGLPIAGMAGDQQAALFGQACFEVGDAKCTYGTGAFLLMQTGTRAIASKHQLITTVAWQLGGASGAPTPKPHYALEGSAFIAGAAVQWLRDGLGLFDTAAEIESLAASTPDSGGVVVVPAFAGLGAPHWRPDARGSITGLTRGTTRAHLARATLEGIALQNVDILRAMEADCGAPLRSLKVDGGAAANNLLMQFQCDVLNVPLQRPQMLETTALGAAMLAGIGCGLWPDPSTAETAWRADRTFSPSMPNATVTEHLARWQAAIAGC
ncbi:MAG: glycerol kinase GlpK [Planctomycetota bacterium]